VLHLVRAVAGEAPGGFGGVQPVGLRLQAGEGLGGFGPGRGQQVMTECGRHSTGGWRRYRWRQVGRDGGCRHQRVEQRPAFEMTLRAAPAQEGAEALL